MSVHADLAWYNSYLVIENRDLKAQIAAYESGEQILKIREKYRKDLAEKDKEIKALKKELANSNARMISMRKNWMQVFEDLQKETDAAVQKKEKEKIQAKEAMWAALRERDEMEAKLKEERKLRYEAQTREQEAQDKLKELTARLNKDYTNSSKPSSQSPNHKKIPNSREKTDRQKGAQPGHEHHGRRKLEPTMPPVEVPPPEEYLDTEKFRPTGKMIHKQLIQIVVQPQVIDFYTPEFRNLETGQRVHASFPNGMTDDVTYDGTVKAMAYLLNNECCVSIEKTKAFIRDITGGKIDLSVGMINQLGREFSEKTQDERNQIFTDLVSSKTMHTDFTFGRMDGKQATVIICTSGDNVLYQGREKKGAEGVKGSPVEIYQGTLISDHEAIFLNYGTRHQECLAHIIRYLIASIENEPDLQWNKLMYALIQEMIHYWNSLNSAEDVDEDKVHEFEVRYDNALQTAKKEYDDVPPAEWFQEGYNLFKRMLEDKEDYILFLKDPDVEPTNNSAERAARRFKRKVAEMMCFRSQDGVIYFCDGLSILESLKSKGENLFESLSERFGTIDMEALSSMSDH